MFVFILTKAGYVPGETIVFNASIDNRSKDPIKSVEAYLDQRTTFIGGVGSRIHHNKIVSALYTGATIGPGTLGNWSNVPFQIPIVCPSLLDTCRIIKLEYILTLNVDFDAITVYTQLDIPIVIGTIPLIDSNASSSTATSNVAYYSIPDSTVHENTPRANTINDPVPNVGTEANFTPKYPYFKDFSLS